MIAVFIIDQGAGSRASNNQPMSIYPRRQHLAAVSAVAPQPQRGYLTSAAAFSLPLLLAACAGPLPALEQQDPTIQTIRQWHAPLPHGGRVSDLGQWWSQFNDPLLLRLIEEAQQASPTLAQASANIADAKAARTASRAALLPSMDISASSTRGRQDSEIPVSTVSSVGLQASWELDLFGAGRAGALSAQLRQESNEAGWHDARVSIAAEVARNYVELRTCEALAQLVEQDAISRIQTASLTSMTVQAGIQSPASAALAQASAAQAKATLIQQQTDCDVLIKAMVALSAQEESALRFELSENRAKLPEPPALHVKTMPADVLSQRPDVHAAALELLAARATTEQVQAQRWPRITLTGNISAAKATSMGVSVDGTVWSVGPVAITFPLFDGGVRRANAQAALVHYEAAKQAYAARVREAVQEVESALLALQSTALRAENIKTAADGFEQSFGAINASYQAGLTNLLDLEESRRSMMSAQKALLSLQYERVLAWISLYRSVGGGWSATNNTTSAAMLDSRNP